MPTKTNTMTNEEILAKVLGVEVKLIKLHKSATLRIDEAIEAMEYAKQQVKSVDLADVVGQSEQLLALAQYMCEHQNNLDGKTAKDYLQDFLSQ